MRWSSWLTNYATNWKVEGSIRDQFFRFFNLLNLSSRTMALGSIQPLTEMSIRNLPGGNGCPEREADFTAICEMTIWKQKIGASTSHNLMGIHGLLQGYENDAQT
jgi:hypothetical protein